MGYYRPHTTQKTTNKDNTLMKPTKNYILCRIFQFLLGLGIFTAAPILGYVLTGQASWLKLMVEFSLYWVAIYLVAAAAVFTLLKLFMKYKNYRAFSILMVNTDWWFYTEDFRTGVEFGITLTETHIKHLKASKEKEALSSILSDKADKQLEEVEKSLKYYELMLENPAKGIELNLKRLEEYTRKIK